MKPKAGNAFESWRVEARGAIANHPSGWRYGPVRLISGPDKARVDEAGEVRMGGAREAGEYVLELTLEAGRLAAIRLELLPIGTNPITRGGGSASFSLSASLGRGTNKFENLAFFHAEATHHEPRYANGHEVLGVRDGWRTAGRHDHQPQSAVWVVDSGQTVNEGDRLLVKVKSDALRRARLSYTPFASIRPLESGAGAELAAALAQKPSRWKEGSGSRVAEAFLLATGAETDAPRFKTYRELDREWLECRNGRTPTVVTEAWNPVKTRLLPRGNWQDESGELVTSATPQFLPNPKADPGQRLSRIDLAEWLVSAQNPLTGRAVMNRLWKQFFGNGLSAVVDDLGAQGEWPTHLELLDWLAVEFRESGWDLKHMVRTVVLSSTYRQSSHLRPELKEADPNNRLLASQNPRRLEAEFVRDNALSVSGLLNLEMGGPSVRPYQPAGYYAPIQFPDRDYQPQTDERQYRRGLYMHWQRTFLHPMLANFDASSREECVAARTVSNTPQQALTLLNDPTFVEAARVLAQHLLEQPGPDRHRLDLAFQRTLLRPARADELDSISRFLAEQLRHYREHGDEAALLIHVGLSPLPVRVDPVILAAWTSTSRVLLNLHESITRY